MGGGGAEGGERHGVIKTGELAFDVQYAPPSKETLGVTTKPVAGSDTSGGSGTEQLRCASSTYAALSTCPAIRQSRELPASVKPRPESCTEGGSSQ